jgi:hypothetical protein
LTVDFPHPGGPHKIRTLGSEDDDISGEDFRLLKIIWSNGISPKVGTGLVFGFKIVNKDLPLV